MITTQIQLRPEHDRALYRQLSDEIIRLIHDGRLLPGGRLPGSRRLATTLRIDRKTVLAGYEDAEQQGYLYVQPGSGFFVNRSLPLRAEHTAVGAPTQCAAFPFDPATHPPPPLVQADWLRITEGAPDVRLAEIETLYVEARKLLRHQRGRVLSRYGDGRGDVQLREELSAYLRRSRGIPAEADRMLICRGSQHGMQLAARLLFREGGSLAVAGMTYDAVVAVARDYGAKVLRLPLDRDGLDVEALAAHPALDTVRAVYVTPHHQYPTTVTLSAERRMRLLNLAREREFAIIEDDYDFDFHYGNGPQLPLAALDRSGSVIYLGSFSKILTPSIRIGYLVAPPDFINAALHHRLLTDRQGDLLLERALAHYIRTGELDRHLRKVRRRYRERRDHFVHLLTRQLADHLTFSVPEGGMAIWAETVESIDGDRLADRCRREGVWFSPSSRSWLAQGGLRLGFAALNPAEQNRAVDTLVRAWE